MPNQILALVALAAVSMSAVAATDAHNSLPLVELSPGSISVHVGDQFLRLPGVLFRIACEGTTLTQAELPLNRSNEALQSASAGNGISVSIATEADAIAAATRIALTIHNPKGVQVNSVQLLDVPLTGTVRSFHGLGQPVYADDLFFGMEYPASDCRAVDNRLHIERFYGTTATQIVCEPIVIGRKRAGLSIGDSFMEYVLERKQHPTRPFALYNTWYDLRDFNEQQVLDTWNTWHRELIEKRGVKLDSFVLDDGWDNYDSLWDKARDRFPDGFKKIRAAIEAGGSRLGVWVSPWGGYQKPAARRRAFGAAHGYEILSDNKGFCLAAPRYKARFIELCREFMDVDGVNYFKFDGFPSRCSNRAHGHPVGDKFEQSAFVDAFLDSLKQLKSKDREVFLNLTTGVWLSPWWLLDGDAVWRGEHDYGAEGTGSNVEKADNYVDCVVYRALREKQAQFPISYLMVHGIIKGRLDVIHHTSETLHEWKDRVAVAVGRGMLMQELYVTPDTLTAEQADFLAEMLKWWRSRAAVLERTHMVFGDPQKSEAYGYVHWKDSNLILLLRNPSDNEQTVTLSAETLGLPSNVGLPSAWKTVYSSAEAQQSVTAGTITLPPRGVLLLETVK